jgi:hypothetical protein
VVVAEDLAEAAPLAAREIITTREVDLEAMEDPLTSATVITTATQVWFDFFEFK